MRRKSASSSDGKSELVNRDLVDGTFVKELRGFMRQMTSCLKVWRL